MLELLLPLFYMLVAGALWRLVGGIIQGMTGHRPAGTAPPVHMVRDPVCGTYVIPDHAVAIADGRTRVYFCSNLCRDKYRARSSTHSTGSGRAGRAEGRTA